MRRGADRSTHERGPRDKLVAWLNDDVPRWFTIVLCLALLGVGSLTGLLVSDSLDSGWVEALGTWVGGIGTLAAVLVAYQIYRSEAIERAVQRATDEMRETDSIGQRAAREERTARLITARLGWRSGQYIGEREGVRFIRVDTLTVTANNRSPEAAYNVEVTYSNTPGVHTSHFDHLPPAGRKQEDWQVKDGALEVPEDQASLAVSEEAFVTVVFDMFDSTWTRKPDGTLVRSDLKVRE